MGGALINENTLDSGKPELGRLIAQVLGNGQTHDGYIVCGSHIVSWCIGHLVKLTPPENLIQIT